MNNQTISYIIASYNDATTIQKTIDSVLVNLQPNDKIIVIDGSSTDNTVELLKSIKINCANLEYLSEPDNGIYDAWNKALKSLSTDWACFLGCGDILHSNYRLEIDNVTKKNNTYNFIHFIAHFYIWNKEKETEIKMRKVGRPFHKDQFKNRMRICHVGALHHKSLFEKNMFSTNYKCVSDYHFLLTRLPILKPFFINKVLADMEGSGISQNSLFPIKEEFLMKKNLGGYSQFSLYKKLILTSFRFYFFKIYDLHFLFK